MATKRLLVSLFIAVLAVSAALLGSAPPAEAQQSGSAHFVDCSADHSGSGTKSRPWTSVKQVNRHTFGPGDKLLFKRGVTCDGMLAPKGSGSARASFMISDYGRAPNRAKIDGNGERAGVKILNQQHISVTNLEITNSEPPESQRGGLLVQLKNFGTGTDYRVQNLRIHDILGGDVKGADGSQGIAFVVSGSHKPTNFDGVRISGNRLDHIDRQGIVTSPSSWSSRPEVQKGQSDNWVPATHVKVQHNTLSDLGGDGIVMNTTRGAVVQHNTVRGFNKRSSGYNAGIWPYNSNDTLFQYNDVSGGHGHRDGMAYDVDQGTINTTFQYNRSHDNEGGFFLLCNNGPGVVRGAKIQHNVSRNDSYRGIENCQGKIDSATFAQNRILIGNGVSQTVVNENTTDQRNVDFRRNRVVKSGSGVADFQLQSGGYAFKHNVFSGVQSPPSQ